MSYIIGNVHATGCEQINIGHGNVNCKNTHGQIPSSQQQHQQQQKQNDNEGNDNDDDEIVVIDNGDNHIEYMNLDNNNNNEKTNKSVIIKNGKAHSSGGHMIGEFTAIGGQIGHHNTNVTNHYEIHHHYYPKPTRKRRRNMDLNSDTRHSKRAKLNVGILSNKQIKSETILDDNIQHNKHKYNKKLSLDNVRSNGNGLIGDGKSDSGNKRKKYFHKIDEKTLNRRMDLNKKHLNEQNGKNKKSNLDSIGNAKCNQNGVSEINTKKKKKKSHKSKKRKKRKKTKSVNDEKEDIKNKLRIEKNIKQKQRRDLIAKAKRQLAKHDGMDKHIGIKTKRGKALFYIMRIGKGTTYKYSSEAVKNFRKYSKGTATHTIRGNKRIRKRTIKNINRDS
eukprot:520764_1